MKVDSVQINSKITGQTALFEDPLFRIDWTPDDPLDLDSGSLDPLRLTRGYLALADHFRSEFYDSHDCAAVYFDALRLS